jgi:hypothetical protein
VTNKPGPWKTLSCMCALGIALSGCGNDEAMNSAPETARTEGSTMATTLVPESREAAVALGEAQASAWELYEALRARANGGQPLDRADMPDWSGLWTRQGNPFFDPDQDFSELTTAVLKPEALTELRERRALSAEGVEYDPISDCSPPGFPRWLAIPFLREFIVTPQQVWLTSETVNNVRRIYTDGRGHPPAEDAYPLWYGDSIGFWAGHTLVIHTSQIQENVFHRNDPRHSDQIEVVEIWHKADDDTMLVDVWSYDPVVLEKPWYVRQTYKRISNPDNFVRIRYWHCSENPNNVIELTEEGSSQFGDFTFTPEE